MGFENFGGENNNKEGHGNGDPNDTNKETDNPNDTFVFGEAIRGPDVFVLDSGSETEKKEKAMLEIKDKLKQIFTNENFIEELKEYLENGIKLGELSNKNLTLNEKKQIKFRELIKRKPNYDLSKFLNALSSFFEKELKAKKDQLEMEEKTIFADELLVAEIILELLKKEEKSVVKSFSDDIPYISAPEIVEGEDIPYDEKKFLEEQGINSFVEMLSNKIMSLDYKDNMSYADDSMGNRDTVLEWQSFLRKFTEGPIFRKRKEEQEDA